MSTSKHRTSYLELLLCLMHTHHDIPVSHAHVNPVAHSQDNFRLTYTRQLLPHIHMTTFVHIHKTTFASHAHDNFCLTYTRHLLPHMYTTTSPHIHKTTFASHTHDNFCPHTHDNFCRTCTRQLRLTYTNNILDVKLFIYHDIRFVRIKLSTSGLSFTTHLCHAPMVCVFICMTVTFTCSH